MPQRHVRGKVIVKLHTLTSALDGEKQLKVLPALCPCQESPGTMGQLAGYVTQSVTEAKVQYAVPCPQHKGIQREKRYSSTHS